MRPDTAINSSMALIDLDDFKSINDQHGHAHGDWVLVELARHLSAGRVEDPAFRLGGDEFALILPYTDRRDAERSVARIETVVREARRLRALGFHLALDDVGAGNAGLDMLRRVAVDFVKIDRSVIAQALTDEGAAGVLSGIIAFARRTGTFVIAEGIETQAMLDIVQVAGLPDTSADTGIQGVQGYLFGRPADVIAPLPVEDETIISFDQRAVSHG